MGLAERTYHRHVSKGRGRGVISPDDATAEIPEVLLRAAERYDSQSNAQFTTFLFRRVVGTVFDALDTHRRRSVHEQLTEDTDLVDSCDTNPTAEETLIAGARRDRVRQALAKLPSDQKAALIRRFYREDLSELPSSPGSKSWQHKLCVKAFATLRVELSDIDAEC